MLRENLMIFIFTPFMSNLINLATVFIVVPAYNEWQTLHMVTKQLLNCHYNVVIVDDGSDISLKKIVSDLPVHLLTHIVNLGQGAALQTGIDFSLSKNAQYIVTFDADAQHMVSDIGLLLQKLVDSGTDIILAPGLLMELRKICRTRKWHY